MLITLMLLSVVNFKSQSLRKININYKEMSDYLNYKVSKKTALIGKIQTPQVNVSSSVAESWENWEF